MYIDTDIDIDISVLVYLSTRLLVYLFQRRIGKEKRKDRREKGKRERKS